MTISLENYPWDRSDWIVLLPWTAENFFENIRRLKDGSPTVGEINNENNV